MVADNTWREGQDASAWYRSHLPATYVPRSATLAAFRKVLQLAASQVGNLCNYSEWAALAEISNDTVADYVGLLEETHVVKLLPPFLGGRRAEITSARKAYFIDNGVRNQLFGGFAPLEDRADAGALPENLGFTEIWKSVNPLLDAQLRAGLRARGPLRGQRRALPRREPGREPDSLRAARGRGGYHPFLRVAGSGTFAPIAASHDCVRPKMRAP